MAIQSVSEIEARRFGRDLELPALGTTVQPTSSGDWPVVEGRENLRQAHIRRATTTRGEMVFAPDYGGNLKQQIEQLNTDAQEALLAASVQSNAARDDRVASVDIAVSRLRSRPFVLILDLVVNPVGETLPLEPSRLAVEV